MTERCANCHHAQLDHDASGCTDGEMDYEEMVWWTCSCAGWTVATGANRYLNDRLADDDYREAYEQARRNLA